MFWKSEMAHSRGILASAISSSHNVNMIASENNILDGVYGWFFLHLHLMFLVLWISIFGQSL